MIFERLLKDEKELVIQSMGRGIPGRGIMYTKILR